MGTNQVVYPNAFEGVNASLSYTYTRSGFEQDVLVQGQLPSPKSFGLDSKTTRLQVLTEFFDHNNPRQAVSSVDFRQDLQDSILTFGQVKLVKGRAFSLEAPAEDTPTYKNWLDIKERKFLMEEVPYSQIAAQLAQLPAMDRTRAAKTETASANPVLNKVSTQRLLPAAHDSGTEAKKDRAKLTRQLARADIDRQRALVLDYVAVDSDQNDFIFQGDTTYYISGNVNLSGNTVIEGGAVIKYTTNVSSSLRILGTVDCRTAPYRPAIFTSTEDNTVGESFSVDAQPAGPPTCSGTFTLQVNNNFNWGFSADEVIYLT